MSWGARILGSILKGQEKMGPFQQVKSFVLEILWGFGHHMHTKESCWPEQTLGGYTKCSISNIL